MPRAFAATILVTFAVAACGQQAPSAPSSAEIAAPTTSLTVDGTTGLGCEETFARVHPDDVIAAMEELGAELDSTISACSSLAEWTQFATPFGITEDAALEHVAGRCSANPDLEGSGVCEDPAAS